MKPLRIPTAIFPLLDMMADSSSDFWLKGLSFTARASNRTWAEASKPAIPHISPACSWRGALLFWVVRPRSGKVDFFSGTHSRAVAHVNFGAIVRSHGNKGLGLEDIGRNC
jgi:hypothetical protein